MWATRLSTVTQDSFSPVWRGTNRTAAVPERSTIPPPPAPTLAPPPAFPPPVMPPGEDEQSSQGPPSPEHFIHNTLYCKSLRPPVSRGRSHSKFTEVPLTEEMTLTGADGGPGEKRDLSSFGGLIMSEKKVNSISQAKISSAHHVMVIVCCLSVFMCTSFHFFKAIPHLACGTGLSGTRCFCTYGSMELPVCHLLPDSSWCHRGRRGRLWSLSGCVEDIYHTDHRLPPAYRNPPHRLQKRGDRDRERVREGQGE